MNHQSPMNEEDREVSRRVILLGASNVTLSFPLILKTLQNSLSGPFDLYTAHGHGRSYCDWSYVLHRGLPSILDCGLWSSLEKCQPAKQSWALITDLGNDLIYGRSVDQVLQQIENAFVRLQIHGAHITFVRPPLERILMLTDRRYRIVKKLLFPGPTVPWQDIRRRILELDEGAISIAQRCNASVITPQPEWYGMDPIHIRRSQRILAWRKILESWQLPEQPIMQQPGQSYSYRAWRMTPAERSLWKRPQLTKQPIWRTPQGLTLWQY